MNPLVRKKIKSRIKITLKVAAIFIAMTTTSQSSFAASSSELNDLYRECIATQTYRQEAECFRSGVLALASSPDRGGGGYGRGHGGYGRGENAMCVGINVFGAYAEGGGCNAFGCYYPGGGCNAFGCYYEGGQCNAFGCIQQSPKTKRACRG